MIRTERTSINESKHYKPDTQANHLSGLRKSPTKELLERFDLIIREMALDALKHGSDVDQGGREEVLEEIATILVLERKCKDPRLEEFVIHEKAT